MIELRQHWVTPFHQELATSEWTHQLLQTLHSHPGLKGIPFHGKIAATHTEERFLGPQSAVKYDFDLRLTQMGPGLTKEIEVLVTYLRNSGRFLLSHWRTHYRSTGRSHRKILERLKILKPEPCSLSSQRLSLRWQTLAHRTGLLLIRMRPSYALFAVHDLKSLEHLPQAHISDRPVQVAWMSPASYRRLALNLLKDSQRQVRVRILPLNEPPAMPVQQTPSLLECRYWLKCTTCAFCLTRNEFCLGPDRMTYQAGAIWEVPISPATFLNLERQYQQFLSAPRKRQSLQLHGQSWEISGPGRRKRHHHRLYPGPLLDFILEHFRLLGIEVSRRDTVW